MNQTENYGMNQWELTDRIRMEDFNGDNAKIDAALKGQAEALAAETAAREAGDAAISQRAGARLIQTLKTTSSDVNCTFSLENIQWEEWKAVHFLFIPVMDSDSYAASLCAGTSSTRICAVNGNTSTSPAEQTHIGHVIVYPMFNRQSSVAYLALSSGQIYPSGRFADLTAIQAESHMSTAYLRPGTTLQVWGEK